MAEVAQKADDRRPTRWAKIGSRYSIAITFDIERFHRGTLRDSGGAKHSKFTGGTDNRPHVRIRRPPGRGDSLCGGEISIQKLASGRKSSSSVDKFCSKHLKNMDHRLKDFEFDRDAASAPTRRQGG